MSCDCRAGRDQGERAGNGQADCLGEHDHSDQAVTVASDEGKQVGHVLDS